MTLSCADVLEITVNQIMANLHMDELKNLSLMDIVRVLFSDEKLNPVDII